MDVSSRGETFFDLGISVDCNLADGSDDWFNNRLPVVFGRDSFRRPGTCFRGLFQEQSKALKQACW